MERSCAAVARYWYILPCCGRIKLTEPAYVCRLCCLCGVAITPNPSNMCVNCIRSQVDITEGIQKQVTLLWCKECERYLQPPKHWVKAALESKELLTLCLKRLKGLQKVCSGSCCTKT